MTWILLFVAGLFEIGFALGLKYSEGFSRLLPTLGMLAAGGLSFYLLSNAMKTLPAGTAYAVWTGIGAAGTAVVGILLLGESSSPLRVASLALIVAGVVGLAWPESGGGRPAAAYGDSLKLSQYHPRYRIASENLSKLAGLVT